MQIRDIKKLLQEYKNHDNDHTIKVVKKYINQFQDEKHQISSDKLRSKQTTWDSYEQPEENEICQHAWQFFSGLEELAKNHLYTYSNCNLLFTHLEEVCELAKVICTLHDNDSEKNLLIEKNIQALAIKKSIPFGFNGTLHFLKKDNLLTQDNFDLIIQSYQNNNSLFASWWIELRESNIATQKNFHKLCHYAKTITHNEFAKIINIFPEGFEITQERFDNILKLCENANGNLSNAVKNIKKYLSALIDLQQIEEEVLKTHDSPRFSKK